MSVNVLDLTCPKCGAVMEANRAKGSLKCPYCGYEEMLTPSDSDTLEEKAYARQKGILRANAEAEKSNKRRRLRVCLIAAAVIAALFAAAFIYNALQPKVNPFDYVTVEFSGKTGDGTAELVYLNNENGDIDAHAITYSISPRSYLSEGDIVTVTAQSSTYSLSPNSKTFKAEGFYTYLTDLSSLSDKAVEMIHNKSDMLTEMAAGGTASVKPVSSQPYMMYLTTDKKTNTLYDVYRVVFSEKDGTECERFTVVYYRNIIVHDADEPTMSYESSMYEGQIVEVLNDSYAGYMTGYKSLKDAKADILAHQSSVVTLQEREAAAP